MNIDFFITFLTVIQTKSFTKTAHITQHSQSTISNRIIELEKHFGHKLFLRKGKYVEATQAGIDLIPYAETMIKTHQDALAKLNNRNNLSPTITIGCTHAFYDSFLCKFLESYILSDKGYKINLFLKHSDEVIQGVVSGKYDIGFSHHTSNYHNIVTRRLYTDQLVFVGPEKIQDHSSTISIADMKDIKVIHSMLYDKFEGDILRKNNIYDFSIDISSRVEPLLHKFKAYGFLPLKMVEAAICNKELYAYDILDYSMAPLESHILYQKDYDREGHPFKAFIEDIGEFVLI